MNLYWSVRRSFVEYVTSAGGEVAVRAPAERAGEGFRLPGFVEDGRWRFLGGVSFHAHGGMLSVSLGHPEVEWHDTIGELSVSATADGTGARTVIARVTAATAVERTHAVPRLTVLGARLFGDVYGPGDALDPLLIDLEGGADA